MEFKRYIGTGDWRDEFALAVLQGIYAGNAIGDTLKQADYEKTARVCYEQADAMLKESKHEIVEDYSHHGYWRFQQQNAALVKENLELKRELTEIKKGSTVGK